MLRRDFVDTPEDSPREFWSRKLMFFSVSGASEDSGIWSKSKRTLGNYRPVFFCAASAF
jgi:hypothetical protein